MKNETNPFRDCTDRKEELEQIERFSMYPVMYYRTNLYIHSLRVSWFVGELIPFALQTWDNFNQSLAMTLALVHDDAEIITGDIQLGHKLKMSPEQLAEVDRQEEKAIEIISQRFPLTVNGFSYKRLLVHALRKDCLEAQMVSLADKLDAYGESLHELLAGNKDFIPPCKNYTRILRDFSNKYPSLRDLFSCNHPLLSPPKDLNYLELASGGQLHTPETIKIPTDCPQYNLWRELTVKKLGEKGIVILVTQKEFHRGI